MNRSWIVGAAIALVTAVGGVTIVFLAADGDDQAQGAAARASESASRTPSTATRRSTTTTTTTTTPGATLPATGPAVTPAPPVDETAAPPDPPDPADRYQPVPMPSDATGQITSCGWSPANGGELRASGIVTDLKLEDEWWMVNLSWLVTNQGHSEEFDYQFQLFDLGPSQTVPWTLTTVSRIAPPNVSCAQAID